MSELGSIERSIGRIEALLESNHEMAKQGLDGVHARIGRLEDTLVDRMKEHEDNVEEELEDVKTSVSHIDETVAEERDRRVALENRGKGFLAAASLVLPAAGAFLAVMWDSIAVWFGYGTK